MAKKVDGELNGRSATCQTSGVASRASNLNRILGKGFGRQQSSVVRAQVRIQKGRHNRVHFSDSKPFDLPCENVSNASFGLDDLRHARIVLQFAAKAENLHINASIEHVFVDSSRL